jgi:hypothetical protein
VGSLNTQSGNDAIGQRKDAVMKTYVKRTFALAGLMGVLITAASVVGGASVAAHGAFPRHDVSAGCAAYHSSFPFGGRWIEPTATIEPRPNTGVVTIGGTYFDPVTNQYVSRPGSGPIDEFVMFRLRIAYRDAGGNWQYRFGDWLGRWNGLSTLSIGDYLVWKNSRWVAGTDWYGWMPNLQNVPLSIGEPKSERHPGSIKLFGAGTYYVGYEVRWTARTDGTRDLSHSEWFGQVTCG